MRLPDKIAFILFLFLVGCTKHTPDSIILTGQIIEMESLGNILLGQSDTLMVTFSGGTDGCAKPDHLDATVAGNVITLKAYYNYPAKPTVCASNIPIHRLKYIFKPATKGTYNYKSSDTDASAVTQVN